MHMYYEMSSNFIIIGGLIDGFHLLLISTFSKKFSLFLNFSLHEIDS